MRQSQRVAMSNPRKAATRPGSAPSTDTMNTPGGMRWLRGRILLAAGVLAFSALVARGQVKGPLTPAAGPGARPMSRPVQPEGAAGTLEQISGDVLTLRTPQGRKVEVMLSSSTRYFLGDRVVIAESLKPGDFVKVLLKPGERGVFFAESVTVDTPKEEEPVLLKRPSRSSPARRTADSADDSERPILRRAPPAKKAETEASEPDTPVPPEGPEESTEETPEQESGEAAKESEPEQDDEGGQASAISVDAVAEPVSLIERAREQVAAYTSQLPNFICREVMTRTIRESRTGGWHTLDVVEADLVYENGKEDYRNIRVGGKPRKSGMAELDGSSSTGEFASTLLSLFWPQTDADFQFVRTTAVNGNEATVYDFSVKQANSSWDVNADGRSAKPAHKGSVWIDNESARVRRLEMQAVDLPAYLSLDTVEMFVDYEKVRIGGLEYLLPVTSENLACWRGTDKCARNRIEFRNYRKFGAESVIVTTDSDIKFEGEEKPK